MKKKTYQVYVNARELRKEMTSAEKILWKFLENRGMCGFKFRRQHPFDRFILDFYCAEIRLGIEVDGEIHKYQRRADAERQMILEENGIQVLRFTNEEVEHSLDSVLRTIKRTLIPSPRSGEGCPDGSRDGVRKI